MDASTTITLPAPAKLNLFLHITGRRNDGYHQLETLFQFLDVGDRLRFQPRSDQQIELLDDSGIATDDNLVMKAARLLKHYAEQHQQPITGVSIGLQKVLPAGGGLGGGSSDAATTLLGLRHLWQLSISDTELRQLALSLGADVPIFIYGQAAFARGVGEQFFPASPACPWYLVAKPNDLHIATAELFQHPDLPRQTASIDFADWYFANSHNDFQQLVCQRYPEVAKLLSWLLEYAPARLTGTGACIFGSFATEAEARAAHAQLPANCSAFVARGLNQSPVIDALANAAGAS